MTQNDIFHEVEVDTNVLKMKNHLNQVKEACGELQDQQKAVRCFSKAKQAENELEDIIRGQSAKDRIQKLHNERENSQSIQDLIEGKEKY